MTADRTGLAASWRGAVQLAESRPTVVLALLLLVVLASRIAALPASIWEQDEAYLAMAVQRFDPANGVPQPPWSPLWLVLGHARHVPRVRRHALAPAPEPHRRHGDPAAACRALGRAARPWARRARGAAVPRRAGGVAQRRPRTDRDGGGGGAGRDVRLLVSGEAGRPGARLGIAGRCRRTAGAAAAPAGSGAAGSRRPRDRPRCARAPASRRTGGGARARGRRRHGGGGRRGGAPGGEPRPPSRAPLRPARQRLVRFLRLRHRPRPCPPGSGRRLGGARPGRRRRAAARGAAAAPPRCRAAGGAARRGARGVRRRQPAARALLRSDPRALVRAGRRRCRRAARPRRARGGRCRDRRVRVAGRPRARPLSQSAVAAGRRTACSRRSASARPVRS